MLSEYQFVVPMNQFKKKMGIKIAYGRAATGGQCKVPNYLVFKSPDRFNEIPMTEAVANEIDVMRKRAKKYFQGETRYLRN